MTETAIQEKWVSPTSITFDHVKDSLDKMQEELRNKLIMLRKNSEVNSIFEEFSSTEKFIEPCLHLSEAGVIEKINECIEKVEEFPISYNQVLVKGSLRYLERIKSRLNPANAEHKKIQMLIEQLVKDLDSLICSMKIDMGAGFSKINLQLYKDRFYIIEDKSSQLRIFPRLKDLQISDLAS